MYRAAQARALLDGRSYCVPDDVKELAVPVFAHRVVVAAMGALPAEPEAAVREVLEAVPVPA
jgi:MoxR-like ATPase